MIESWTLDRLKKEWANHRGNPKNWTYDDWVNDVWESRVFFGFLFGFVLAAAMLENVFLVFVPVVIAFIAVMEFFNRRNLRQFKEGEG